jgi:hypothetical protein
MMATIFYLHCCGALFTFSLVAWSEEHYGEGTTWEAYFFVAALCVVAWPIALGATVSDLIYGEPKRNNQQQETDDEKAK